MPTKQQRLIAALLARGWVEQQPSVTRKGRQFYHPAYPNPGDRGCYLWVSRMGTLRWCRQPRFTLSGAAPNMAKRLLAGGGL